MTLIVEVNCPICEETYTIELKEAGELPDVVCLGCGNEHIFFGNIKSKDDDKPFKLPGTGGCGRCG